MAMGCFEVCIFGEERDSQSTVEVLVVDFGLVVRASPTCCPMPGCFCLICRSGPSACFCLYTQESRSTLWRLPLSRCGMTSRCLAWLEPELQKKPSDYISLPSRPPACPRNKIREQTFKRRFAVDNLRFESGLFAYLCGHERRKC